MRLRFRLCGPFTLLIVGLIVEDENGYRCYGKIGLLVHARDLIVRVIVVTSFQTTWNSKIKVLDGAARLAFQELRTARHGNICIGLGRD